MRSVFAASVAVTFAWMAMPSMAAAQDRTGVWFALGGGYGSADVTCKECGATDRQSSGVGYLRGGWSLNPQTRIGVEYDVWTKKQAVETGVEGTVSLSNVSGTISYYPSPTANFFVKGGVGASLVSTEFTVQGSKISADLGKGLGVIVGAGYDIRVGKRWAVTPAVDFWYGNQGDIKLAGQTIATDWKQNVLDLTIGVTFR